MPSTVETAETATAAQKAVNTALVALTALIAESKKATKAATDENYRNQEVQIVLQSLVEQVENLESQVVERDAAIERLIGELQKARSQASVETRDDTPRSKTAFQELRTISASGGGAAATDGKWACLTCTFHNEPGITSCAICTAERN